LTISRVPRWKTCQHLIEEGTKSPPVYSKAVSLTCENLGCQVLWRAAERLGPTLGLGNTTLAQTEVCQEYVAVAADEDVL
jgi:hypothetical protein